MKNRPGRRRKRVTYYHSDVSDDSEEEIIVQRRSPRIKRQRSRISYRDNSSPESSEHNSPSPPATPCKDANTPPQPVTQPDPDPGSDGNTPHSSPPHQPPAQKKLTGSAHKASTGNFDTYFTFMYIYIYICRSCAHINIDWTS
jgi:hypothetical protein